MEDRDKLTAIAWKSHEEWMVTLDGTGKRRIVVRGIDKKKAIEIADELNKLDIYER